MDAVARSPRPGARRRRGAPVVAACLAALGLTAGTAVGAPTISGADGDVWNLSKPVPSYDLASLTALTGGITWTIDGVATTQDSAAFTVTLPGLADGAHTLTAKDANGIDPTVTPRGFVVDLTAPKITIARPAANAQFDLGASVIADYTCDAPCAGSVGGTAVASGAALDTSRAGSYTLRVQATDEHGNDAVSLADFVVKQPGMPTAQTSGAPSEPISLVQTPSTPTTSGARRPPYRPRTVNAKALRPAVGLRLPTRTPLLRWGARRGATLYNVQIYWLRGTSATKVASLFPRSNHLRVPAGRVAYGHTYIWRVWPYLRGHYAARPLGLSYFTVKKNPKR